MRKEELENMIHKGHNETRDEKKTFGKDIKEAIITFSYEK